jgi:hypothetical protein
MIYPTIHAILRRGCVIPAHPLALDAQRKLDESRQRGLSRYYAAAGAGGLAVGVHTTQFPIHDPKVGLYRPVLAIAVEEMDRADAGRAEPLVRVAGIVGKTDRAVAEAALARELGFHAGLLGLGAMADADEPALVTHCRAVAEVLPVFGFYLQPAVGGRKLPYAFWRQFAEIENVAAIKVAAFNRYQTLDVVRAIAESGRDDIALYTGNDDNIVVDLVTPFRFDVAGRTVERRFVGGLLGHWAFWTRGAVALHRRCREAATSGGPIPPDLLATAVEVTDVNAAAFDVAHDFAGCIPGIHEMLRRQGVLEGIWCLDPHETLSPGQLDEIDRVCRCYPHLADEGIEPGHGVANGRAKG